MKRMLIALCLSFTLTLAGCGIGGIQDVKARTEKLETKAEVEKVLGKPTRISGVSLGGGSAESLIYETSDGVATFQVLNGKVVLRTYGSKDGK